MRNALAILVLLAGCGPARPARTSVTSSAAEVSPVEGAALPRARELPTAAEGDDEDQGEDQGEDEVMLRRGGSLVVHAPPRSREKEELSSFRRHVEGSTLAGEERIWVGTDVPGFVELTDGTRELTLLDATRDGYLAVYRDPVGASSCTADSARNCSVSTILYSAAGKKLWRYQLDDHLERDRGLEIADVRYGESMLYLSQVCSEPSPGDEACARITALDTRTSKVAWKSPTGSGGRRFAVLADHLVAVRRRNESGRAVLISRDDGSRLHALDLAIVPAEVEAEADDAVTIIGAGEARKSVRIEAQKLIAGG